MHQFTPIPEFDQLTAMAENNPDQLEALRLELINETISFAEEGMQRKLRGLQFHIDMEIRRSKTPMAIITPRTVPNSPRNGPPLIAMVNSTIWLFIFWASRIICASNAALTALIAEGVNAEAWAPADFPIR